MTSVLRKGGTVYIPWEALQTFVAIAAGTISSGQTTEGYRKISIAKRSNVEQEVNTPAVATNAQVAVTALQIWRILAIIGMISCDANAANRVVSVDLTSGTIITGMGAGTAKLAKTDEYANMDPE